MVPYIGWLVSSFVCAKYATVRDTEHGVHVVELVQCVSKFIALKKLEQQWQMERGKENQFSILTCQTAHHRDPCPGCWD